MEFTEDIKKALDQSVLCWLATASAEGVPNVSPKEIFCWQNQSTVLIANIASPGSVKNIKQNPKVCLSVLDILVQKGYQLKGMAEIITHKDERFKSLSAPLLDLAGPDFPFSSLTKIVIETAKPIIAPRYLLFPETSEKDQIKSGRKLYGF